MNNKKLLIDSYRGNSISVINNVTTKKNVIPIDANQTFVVPQFAIDYDEIKREPIGYVSIDTKQFNGDYVVQINQQLIQPGTVLNNYIDSDGICHNAALMLLYGIKSPTLLYFQNVSLESTVAQFKLVAMSSGSYDVSGMLYPLQGNVIATGLYDVSVVKEYSQQEWISMYSGQCFGTTDGPLIFSNMVPYHLYSGSGFRIDLYFLDLESKTATFSDQINVSFNVAYQDIFNENFYLIGSIVDNSRLIRVNITGYQSGSNQVDFEQPIRMSFSDPGQNTVLAFVVVPNDVQWTTWPDVQWPSEIFEHQFY